MCFYKHLVQPLQVSGEERTWMRETIHCNIFCKQNNHFLVDVMHYIKYITLRALRNSFISYSGNTKIAFCNVSYCMPIYSGLLLPGAQVPRTQFLFQITKKYDKMRYEIF